MIDIQMSRGDKLKVNGNLYRVSEVADDGAITLEVIGVTPRQWAEHLDRKEAGSSTEPEVERARCSRCATPTWRCVWPDGPGVWLSYPENNPDCPAGVTGEYRLGLHWVES